MTVTTPPPPAPTAEDIPGVTRRHRLSDLYHERTNFQFIKHSRRWLIISGTLVVLSLVLLFGVRGLNFGIDFEGGTAWQVADGRRARPRSVADVRDLLDPLGFADAKVSVYAAGRRAARRVNVAGAASSTTRSQTIQDALANVRRRRPTPTCSSRAATAADRSRSPPRRA